ncbi:pyrokinin-1 receptor-like isoform X1 [Sipha flava]|uniref:Neuromedin-U receptor 2 n=2 Tax=Sipha flava TaxID=143950 RepID=A0A2S2RBD1_9HEMI|nr:pyrokinin-1 receptor-like isoform X1 [Sipha flava]XP_025404903.1 pyrokinin-1 receptor-like isoform X1 [Sipha flava]XP_025404904.1 pyrokinin-1 receptor-like isoform X1 [Sipha flava]XP_025404905.1 pyrokinin-1 receptor-like isoform X1 [Sipha flava]XP_025404906.1 pyrokinin-1 receptor-like isoform X1 [Sipha flava]
MSLHGDGGNMSAESGSFLMPKRDPLYIVVPMIIMYSVIFVTGVIGNSITCLVIAKHKYMHTATNYYLFSLAVSDLILLVSGLPQEMWSIWSKYPYIFGEIFCQLRGLFAEMSANATVLTITAFTAERYVAICHPFMAQSMSKLSRAVKLIVIIWLVAVMFAIPQALQFTVSSYDGMPEVTQCNIKTIQLMDTDVKLSTVSFTLSTLLFFVLPMTFITVLYALIGLRLRRSDKLKRTITVRSSCGEKKISSPEYRANSSSKVLKMLVAVVVAFFICWAPFHAQRLIAIFWSNHASSKDEDIPFLHQLYGITTYVSGVLYYMSTTINPILYHIMSLKFRTAFKETVLRCCGGDGDGRPSSRSEQLRWQRSRGQLLHGDGDPPSPGAADHGLGGGRWWRQEYRRVSGRTASTSVELSSDGDRADVGTSTAAAGTTATTAAGLAECWRRTLKGSANGAEGIAARRGCDGCSGRPRNDADDCCSCCCCCRTDSSTTPVRDDRLPAAALSNWTVISNSSLRDVDGDDLRDELVGYAVDGTVAITSAVMADNFDGIEIVVGHRS